MAAGCLSLNMVSLGGKMEFFRGISFKPLGGGAVPNKNPLCNNPEFGMLKAAGISANLTLSEARTGPTI